MKKSLVLAMAMALGVTASAYAANPFSDVPAGHWAYDSVNKLAAAGVIEGYPDGTYGGDKLMTRYEMAQIVAKAMAKGANVDKLAAEFADELDSLGVRVAALEKKSDNVKITGEIRAHYEDRDADNKEFKAAHGKDSSKLRSRLWIKGQINEDWAYTGMIQNEQDFMNNSGDEDVVFQRAFVTGKLGGLAIEAGRNNRAIADGFVLSHRTDAVKASYGKDVKLTGQIGKLANATKEASKDLNDGSLAGDYWAATLSGNMGALNLEANYVDVQDQTKLGGVDNKIWTVGAKYAIDKNVTLKAMYLKGDVENTAGDDDGYVVGLAYKGAKASQPGSWGISGEYLDQAASTVIANGYNSTIVGDFLGTDDGGLKGYRVGVNYAFAKGIVGTVEYYDFEAKVGNHEDNALRTQVVFTF